MPPKRKRRAPPAKSQWQTEPDPQVPPGADAPLEERLIWVSQQESERRITAIKATQDAEAGNIPYQLQLVRSYCSKEQLEGNAMQYFQENLPDLSVVPNEEYDVLELKWNNGDEWMIGDFADDRTLRASIASFTTADGLQFPRDPVGEDFYRRTSNFSDFAWSEQPEGQMAGAAEAFQTPGAVSIRLSCVMTPKTVRLPKNGEMLLSVRGSPLGVYKEENLSAIEGVSEGVTLLEFEEPSEQQQPTPEIQEEQPSGEVPDEVAVECPDHRPCNFVKDDQFYFGCCKYCLLPAGDED